jgi:hypothetical protein
MEMSDDSDEIVSAVQEVEYAVKAVERAVNEKWSTLQGIGVILVVFLVVSWIDDAWHSKWRYGMTYDVPSDKIQIEVKPHDCAFLAAPLGEKYCHYERNVMAVQWGRSNRWTPDYFIR